MVLERRERGGGEQGRTMTLSPSYPATEISSPSNVLNTSSTLSPSSLLGSSALLPATAAPSGRAAYAARTTAGERPRRPRQRAYQGSVLERLEEVVEVDGARARSMSLGASSARRRPYLRANRGGERGGQCASTRTTLSDASEKRRTSRTHLPRGTRARSRPTCARRHARPSRPGRRRRRRAARLPRPPHPSAAGAAARARGRRTAARRGRRSGSRASCACRRRCGCGAGARWRRVRLQRLVRVLMRARWASARVTVRRRGRRAREGGRGTGPRRRRGSRARARESRRSPGRVSPSRTCGERVSVGDLVELCHAGSATAGVDVRTSASERAD